MEGDRARSAASLAPLAVGVVAALLILLHPGVHGFVESLHVYNPTPDLPSDVAISILVGLGIGYSIYLWPVGARDRTILRRAWWIHMLLILGPLLYLESIEDSIDGFRHYRETVAGGTPLDILRYGGDIRYVNFLAWFPIRLFGGSYHATQMLFVLVGLIGALLLARAAQMLVGRDDPRPLILFAFFPTVLAWGSFLNKEALTYFAVGCYAYGIVAFSRAPSRRAILSIAAGVALASILRFWLAFILLAPFAIFLLASRRTWNRRAVALGIGATALAVLALAYVLARFGVGDLPGFVVQLDTMSHSFSAVPGAPGEDIGRTGRVAPRFDSLWDIARFLPIGMFSVAFLPLPWQMAHPVVWQGGLDSILLIAAFWGSIALVLARREVAKLRSPLFVWAVALIAVWAAAYTFPIYQNIGLAVRTRMMIVPIILLVPFILFARAERHAWLVVKVDPAATNAGSREHNAARTRDEFRIEQWRADSRILRALALRRPGIVQTRSGPGAARGMLAAWLTGVPVRLHARSGRRKGLNEWVASALATAVLPPSPDQSRSRDDPADLHAYRRARRAQGDPAGAAP